MNSNNPQIAAGQKVKRMWTEATVTRADGTIEHHGIIADTRLSFRIRRAGQRFAAIVNTLLGKEQR